jgi:site-specific DNA-methyltransferase (cytosine-N4-specific)
MGSMWLGDSLDLLRYLDDDSVDLIVTSPPFALTFPKEYGNRPGDEYVNWFEDFALEFRRVMAERGSLVIELGGAWLPGQPTRSLYQYRLLIQLVDELGFHLAEDFYWFNRAKLPGPQQWVSVQRNRVKDAVNTIWWLSKTPNPKADNLRVLKPYSKDMVRLIRRGTYNAGSRPSQHIVGGTWAQDRGGAIPPNVIDVMEPVNLLEFGNNAANDSYHAFCRANELKRHPARFPRQVPEFFVKFLTDPGDMVLDPFGGSNVSGAVADALGRRWQSCEIDRDYVVGSLGRFPRERLTLDDALGDLDLDQYEWPQRPRQRKAS